MMAVVAIGTPSTDAVTVIVPGTVPTGRTTAIARPRHTALVFCRSEVGSDGSPLPTASNSPGPVTTKVTTGAALCTRVPAASTSVAVTYAYECGGVDTPKNKKQSIVRHIQHAMWSARVHVYACVPPPYNINASP